MGLIVLLIAFFALFALAIGLLGRINPRQGRTRRRYGIAGSRLYWPPFGRGTWR